MVDRLQFLERAREDFCKLLDLRRGAEEVLDVDNEVVVASCDLALSVIEAYTRRHFRRGVYTETFVEKSMMTSGFRYTAESPLIKNEASNKYFLSFKINNEEIDEDGETLYVVDETSSIFTLNVSLAPGSLLSYSYEAGVESSVDIPQLHSSLVQQAISIYHQKDILGVYKISADVQRGSDLTFTSSGSDIVLLAKRLLEPLRNYGVRANGPI